jgi:hypothetical protein
MIGDIHNEDNHCVNDKARIFFQYYCALYQDEMDTGSKVMNGNIYIALAIVIAFYIGYFYHLYKFKKSKDFFFLNKINPSAYTLKARFKKDKWEELIKGCRDGEKILPFVQNSLTYQIEKVLEDKRYDESTDVSIVSIKFHFEDYKEQLGYLMKQNAGKTKFGETPPDMDSKPLTGYFTFATRSGFNLAREIFDKDLIEDSLDVT